MGWLWKIEAGFFCSREEGWKRNDVWALPPIVLEPYDGEKPTDLGARRLALTAATVYSGAHPGKRAVGVYELKITTTRWFSTKTWSIAVNVPERGGMNILPGSLT